jgi:uncharacterized protein with PQ loop repeat
MELSTFLGFSAGILFAYSGIPLAIKTIKDGHSNHTPIQLILCVFLGAIFMLYYLIDTYGFDIIVFLEYSVTILVWLIILIYKLK